MLGVARRTWSGSRRRAGGAWKVVVVVAMLTAAAGATGPAPAGASIADQVFSASGSGAVLSMEGARTADASLAHTLVAYSGGEVDSGGLRSKAPRRKLRMPAAPADPDGNALAEGTGVEVRTGVGTATEAVNLAALAKAVAPPAATHEAELAIDLAPALLAESARGRASARYDADFCPVGEDFTFAEGQVENLEVLGAGTPAAFLSSNDLSESKTVTSVMSNGDGTFGLVTETSMTVAPVVIGPTAGEPLLFVEIAGELVLRVIATGKPGGARIEWSGTPVVSVRSLGVPIVGPIALGSIGNPNGLQLDIPLVANLTVGAPPEARDAPVGTPPMVAADGTSASASVDVVDLELLQGLAGLTAGVDLRIGHMEGSVTVPEGGLRCAIPLAKRAGVEQVTAGEDFTVTISVPSDAARFDELFACDLLDITVTDRLGAGSGQPRFEIRSASDGGRITGDSVTWDGLPDYHPGDPPIELTVTARALADSPAGVVHDTADVSADLGRCAGGGPISGTVTFDGPQVLAAVGDRASSGTGSPAVAPAAASPVGVGPPAVAGTVVESGRDPSGTLPATGRHIALSLLVGVVLLGAGEAIRRRARLHSGR